MSHYKSLYFVGFLYWDTRKINKTAVIVFPFINQKECIFEVSFHHRFFLNVISSLPGCCRITGTKNKVIYIINQQDKIQHDKSKISDDSLT